MDVRRGTQQTCEIVMPTADQLSAIDHLASTVGVPTFIILVFFILVFAAFKWIIWPSLILRQMRLDDEHARFIDKQEIEHSLRHKEYLESFRVNMEVNQATAKVLIMLQQQMVEDLKESDAHEINAMRRNDELRELLNRRFDDLIRIIQG